MLPIAPLMIEHRLIERMIRLMKAELARKGASGVNAAFAGTVVDFLRTYADRVHHGKEEDILFAELVRLPLSREHSRAVDELTQEHRWARERVGQMAAAAERLAGGDTAAALDVSDCMRQLAEIYPRHIEREDRHFFLPVMAYFAEGERDRLLQAFQEFDRQMIHEKYRGVVEVLERAEAKR